MTMSEDSMDMVMSLVIPGCWAVGWASRLAAERSLGKLTPLDFMRMSEMSMVLTKSEDERTWGGMCQKAWQCDTQLNSQLYGLREES